MNRKLCGKLCLLLLTAVAPMLAGAQQAFEITLDKPERYGSVPKGFVTGDFQLWLPSRDIPLNYVLFLVPGQSRTLHDADKFRDFAVKNHCAILTAGFVPKQSGPDWGNVEQWSGKMALDALKKLAAAAEKPELSNLPLLLWASHDIANDMASNFAAWKPGSVAAFVAVPKFKNAPDAHKVTGLLLERANAGELPNALEQYAAARQRRAAWSFAVIPNGSGTPEYVALSLAFFDAVVKQRASGKDESWTGSLKDWAIAAKGGAGAGAGNARDGVWLPDEEFARAWRLFVSGQKN